MIGDGVCACGCGQPTRIGAKNDRRNGTVKGMPSRYLPGHSTRHRRALRWEIAVDIQADECWVWRGCRDGDGYGSFQRRKAHRVFYEAFVGPVPPHLQIDHLCRNRACVNPDHLEPVTLHENVRRGRHHHLTPEQVREIRRRPRSQTNRAIAAEFGVAEDVLSRARRRITYADVPDKEEPTNANA